MRYEIKGDNLPVVICQVENGESMICEGGAMSWMSANMKFETIGGGAGKMLGRLVTGESLFMNRYTAAGGPGMIAFASSFPGSIRAYEITPDKPIIVQKRSFLAAAAGVQVSTHFNKGVGKGLFGGEGFIMQRLDGKLVIDTGHLAMMDATVSIDVQRVKGAKNMLFGGEGLFNTVVTGPGRVLLQTMPLVNFVGQISSMLPSK